MYLGPGLLERDVLVEQTPSARDFCTLTTGPGLMLGGNLGIRTWRCVPLASQGDVSVGGAQGSVSSLTGRLRGRPRGRRSGGASAADLPTAASRRAIYRWIEATVTLRERPSR